MLKNEACKMNSELRKKYSEKVCGVLHEVAIALQRLHSCGIVHGTLSPSSCGKFNQSWKLLGALKLQSIGDTFNCTRFEVSVPPEAVEPQNNALALECQVGLRKDVLVDPSIDIWGFGRLAYDVLVGHPLIPFDRNKDTAHDQKALLKIMHWSALDLVEARSQLRQVGLPESGVDLIAKCLAKDPKARPSNMDEILGSMFFEEHQESSVSLDQQLHEC